MPLDTKPFEGRGYVPGQQDCYGSFRDLFISATGEPIPDFARPDSWWNHPDLDLVTQQFEKAGFKDTGLTVNGSRPLHVLLFAVAGSKINHVGVALGGGRFFHHPFNGLSRIDPLTPQWKSRCVKVIEHENYKHHVEKYLIEHLEERPIVVKRKWVRL